MEAMDSLDTNMKRGKEIKLVESKIHQYYKRIGDDFGKALISAYMAGREEADIELIPDVGDYTDKGIVELNKCRIQKQIHELRYNDGKMVEYQ